MSCAADVKCPLILIPDENELRVIEQILEVAWRPFLDRSNAVLVAKPALNLWKFRFIHDDPEEAGICSFVAQLRDLLSMRVG